MFEGIGIVVGVSGGIAAYRACDLVRLLVKDGMDVHVVMTEAGARFISPLTFRALSGHDVGLDIFGTSESIGHIALARKAKAIVIAPATANTIAKLAHGMADNLLTALSLAARVPVLVAPAMNSAMWENPATRENVVTLKRRGVRIIGPAAGEMACGEHGEGKLADAGAIAETVRMAVALPKDFAGKRFVVNSGPTREPLDPVRFISNRSSGRMGTAMARALALRGAEVTFVHGPSEVPPPMGVRAVSVETAEEMRSKTIGAWKRADGAVLVAAVADFKPVASAAHKIKKAAAVPAFSLVETRDILAEMGKNKGKRFLCGFAAETRDLVKNASEKLREKNLDMVVANDVSGKAGGFGSTQNAVTVLTKGGARFEVPLSDKDAVAWALADVISGEMIHGRRKTNAR
ncbi:MAG: bifunctional phosphopantothenoylcysteine decarboxylase/phosphopantothenate--cysteine ligase CoaBC [Deltaproteobacteria bacterium]|nr:bifunctional phosphopantothenoylcysteine decarboxylase/phosphopantothenate--cysteine ligase CoaBC [Deltaproteobacteria bacterium]